MYGVKYLPDGVQNAEKHSRYDQIVRSNSPSPLKYHKARHIKICTVIFIVAVVVVVVADILDVTISVTIVEFCRLTVTVCSSWSFPWTLASE